MQPSIPFHNVERGRERQQYPDEAPTAIVYAAARRCAPDTKRRARTKLRDHRSNNPRDKRRQLGFVCSTVKKGTRAVASDARRPNSVLPALALLPGKHGVTRDPALTLVLRSNKLSIAVCIGYLDWFLGGGHD